MVAGCVGSLGLEGVAVQCPRAGRPVRSLLRQRGSAMAQTAYGLPGIDDLLVELNDRRKFEAYGDIELPQDEDRDAQDTAAEIRAYFEAVEAAPGP